MMTLAVNHKRIFSEENSLVFKLEATPLRIPENCYIHSHKCAAIIASILMKRNHFAQTMNNLVVVVAENHGNNVNSCCLVMII